MGTLRALQTILQATTAGLIGALSGGVAGVLVGCVAALVLMVFRMSLAWVTVGPRIGWTPFDFGIPVFLAIAGVIIGAFRGVTSVLLGGR